MSILIITGPCGSGKTTTAKLLQQQLDPTKFVVHDFDELGILDMPDHIWRQETTDYWLQKAQVYEQEQKSTIICGLMFPMEVMNSLYLPKIAIHFGFLDVSPDQIVQRLGKRDWYGRQIMNNIMLMRQLEYEVARWPHFIVDGKSLDSQQVADQCLSYIALHLQPIGLQRSDVIEISVELVTKLIMQQCPQWQNLPIVPVENQGHDHRIFRLGDTMLVRLPSCQDYALQVIKEANWLPVIAESLSCKIPKPILLCTPSADYPWCWGVYEWIEGKTALSAIDDPLINMAMIAIQVALFLQELSKIEISDEQLKPGLHNFYRGGTPGVYDTQVRALLAKLGNLIDVQAAGDIWETAISSESRYRPIIVHGDLSAGNLLVGEKKLEAVIDFGCMGLGDPACDLVIAWNFFDHASRIMFKKFLRYDDSTWARARGWALWKALLILDAQENKHSVIAVRQLLIIAELVQEHGAL